MKQLLTTEIYTIATTVVIAAHKSSFRLKSLVDFAVTNLDAYSKNSPAAEYNAIPKC